MFAGAVTLLVHDGVVVTRDAVGDELRYTDAAGTQLPPAQRVPVHTDTIFDLASMTKLFTSIAVLQIAEAGRIDINAPVARYLPEFGVNGKAAITVKQMLTHVSGLPPDLALWKDWPDKASRIKAVMDVTPVAPAGTKYIYSDLNLITLGVLVERMTGSTLDVVVRDRITGPLHMVDTGFNPSPSLIPRIAATEFEVNPPRGMVRGSVHDENAWSLGGVAGHAGIFSTADDIAIIGQTMLNGGIYKGTRILAEATVKLMLTNFNTQFPGDSHGLGFELDQRWYMDALTSPRTAGHTGFTGTSIVIDFMSRSIVVLLTNRVHPTRDWGPNTAARRAVAHGLALALAVRPLVGGQEWYADIPVSSTAVLQVSQPLTARRGNLEVLFGAFVDIDSADSLSLEYSTDGGTGWQPAPMSVYGPGAPSGQVTMVSGSGHRAWWWVRAALPNSGQGQPVLLRWRYTTGAPGLLGDAPTLELGAHARAGVGRGVDLDGILVLDGRGIVLDGERQPDAFSPTRFRLANR